MHRASVRYSVANSCSAPRVPAESQLCYYCPHNLINIQPQVIIKHANSSFCNLEVTNHAWLMCLLFYRSLKQETLFGAAFAFSFYPHYCFDSYTLVNYRNAVTIKLYQSSSLALN